MVQLEDIHSIEHQLEVKFQPTTEKSDQEKCAESNTGLILENFTVRTVGVQVTCGGLG